MPLVSHGNRKWWVLAAMSGALAMVLLDQTIVGVALPTIQADLGASPTAAQWIVNAYLLAMAALIAAGGRLSDIYGAIRLFYAGVVVFAVSSALCGLAQSEAWIVAARAVQGLGAALMIPSSMAVAANAFAPRERGRAIGTYQGIAVTALALGPLLGGAITQFLSWRWVFWVNVPVAAAIVLTTAASRPSGVAEHVQAGQRLDVRGLVALVCAVCGVVTALMQGSAWGWTSAPTLVALSIGAAASAAFVFIELRAREGALVDIRLLGDRNFGGASLVLFSANAVAVAFVVFGSIYMQTVLRAGPLMAGLAMLPAIIPSAVISPIAGGLADRFGPRRPAVAGSIMAAMGYAWIAGAARAESYGLLASGLVFASIGLPLVFNSATVSSLNAVPASRRGEASGTIESVQQIGGAVGLAVVGAVMTGVAMVDVRAFLEGAGSRYESLQGTVERLLTAGQAEGARSTTLPGSVMEVIKDAAAAGFEAAFFVAAGLMVAAAVVAGTLMARDAATADPSTEGPNGGSEA